MGKGRGELRTLLFFLSFSSLAMTILFMGTAWLANMIARRSVASAGSRSFRISFAEDLSSTGVR